MQDTNVMKVCTAQELEHLTASGWQLEQVLQGSAVHPLTYEERVEKSDAYSHDRTVNLIRDAVVTEHRFLVRKSASTINAELQIANTALHNEIQKMQTQETALQREQEKLADDKRALEGRIKQYNSCNEGLSASLEIATSAKRRMENDIAKIRKEIGEAAMKKILEPAA